MLKLIRAGLAVVLIGLAAAIAGCTPTQKGPLVLAAASLQEAMNQAADAWAAKGHPRPVVSFAGSSALARQIDAGAPADIFVSADLDWMNDVERHGRVVAGTRANMARNRLVLVAPKSSKVQAVADPANDLIVALGKQGRLAMADPDAVPAGKYGKASLQSLGIWELIAHQVVAAENVRAALALVERDAATLGVVYRTDAMASPKVKIVGSFPDDSHPPIVYPVARLNSAHNPDAEGFRQFLLSPAGQRILIGHGFSAP